MPENIEISVICPVYNAGQYLRRSIESIVSQTFNQYELILVDDGSTDGSGAVCDEYAAGDSRVKVIHKRNGGVASARQAGMDAASGKWFIHMDSDDWVDSDWLERLHDVAVSSGAEVVCCDFCTVYRNRREYSGQCHVGWSSERIARAVSGGKMSHSLCNKLILRSVYDRYGLCFPEGLKTAEDAYVCHSLFIRGVTCAFCRGAYYYYDRFSCNSLTRSGYQRSLDAIMLCVRLLEEVPGNAGIRSRSLYTMKSLAKLKAFYCLPFSEFRALYHEINVRYFFRNIWKVRTVEGYVALSLLIRSNTAAYSLYTSLKNRFGVRN